MSHPGAHRNRGSQTRAHPYNRQTQSNNGKSSSVTWYDNAPPPRGDSEASWKHDLFTRFSDIYEPSPNATFADPQPKSAPAPNTFNQTRSPQEVNPSLRPWGSWTPASSFGQSASLPAPVQDAGPAVQQPKRDPPTQPKQSLSLFDRVSGAAQNSLLDRLSTSLNDPAVINRPASAPPPGKKALEQTRKPRNSKPLPRGPAAASRPGLQTATSAGPWGEPSGDTGMDVDMDDEPRAPAKPRGTVVRVANLIEGTSAEDVETAFSGFGSIYSTEIVERKNGLLTAEIGYHEEAAAKRAAIELDGQIADGQALSVKIIVQPPPMPVVVKAAPPSVRTIPTGPKNRAPPARLAQVAPKEPAAQQSSNLFARMGIANGSSSQVPTGPAQRQASRPAPVASTSAPVQPATFNQAPNGMQMGIPEFSSALRSDRIAAMDPRASFQSQPFVAPGAQTADYQEEQRRIRQEEEAEARASKQDEQRNHRKDHGRGRGRGGRSRPAERASQPAPPPQLTLAQRLGISS